MTVMYRACHRIKLCPLPHRRSVFKFKTKIINNIREMKRLLQGNILIGKMEGNFRLPKEEKLFHRFLCIVGKGK